ncbi:FUSC family protein [Shewanella submarina]|uniref:FUSC family protein n=1 Tax=Shewanella submarina TaxID=2016376 RepID=A0ABV7GCH8_9GAMM|nr:FUSC family protein [Shewanella submarina]MCL1037509.1 FUSC family protein [Shewanella submarina]
MSVFSPDGKFTRFIYQHARVVHAFKLFLALLIAIVINGIWPLPHFIWSMVTIVIIMLGLPQVGSALEKSLQRAIGTCVGSLCGVLLIVGFQNYWALMGLLAMAVGLVCYIGKGRYSYAYLVTGFTMIIVVGDANHDTTEAVWRTANILLGCLIAVCVSLFILPIKAKQDWRQQLSTVFAKQGSMLKKHLSAGINGAEDCRAELESTMKSVLAQKKLFFSLEWESRTLRHHKQRLEQLTQEQIRLVTLMEILSQTRWRDDEYCSYAKINQLTVRLLPVLESLSQYVAGTSQSLAPLPEQMGMTLHQELLASLDEHEQHQFALTGYTWLLYQYACAVESLHADIAALGTIARSR